MYINQHLEQVAHWNSHPEQNWINKNITCYTQYYACLLSIVVSILPKTVIPKTAMKSCKSRFCPKLPCPKLTKTVMPQTESSPSICTHPPKSKPAKLDNSSSQFACRQQSFQARMKNIKLLHAVIVPARTNWIAWSSVYSMQYIQAGMKNTKSNNVKESFQAGMKNIMSNKIQSVLWKTKRSLVTRAREKRIIHLKSYLYWGQANDEEGLGYPPMLSSEFPALEAASALLPLILPLASPSVPFSLSSLEKHVFLPQAERQVLQLEQQKLWCFFLLSQGQYFEGTLSLATLHRQSQQEFFVVPPLVQIQPW